jgi:hypothetical protein
MRKEETGMRKSKNIDHKKSFNLLSIVCYDKKEGNFKKCEKSQIRD